MNSDFKDLLSILNESKAKYLIVGGYAVMKYTEPRYYERSGYLGRGIAEECPGRFRCAGQVRSPADQPLGSGFRARGLVLPDGQAPDACGYFDFDRRRSIRRRLEEPGGLGLRRTLNPLHLAAGPSGQQAGPWGDRRICSMWTTYSNPNVTRQTIRAGSRRKRRGRRLVARSEANRASPRANHPRRRFLRPSAPPHTPVSIAAAFLPSDRML
jgi:hypothetical protein